MQVPGTFDLFVSLNCVSAHEDAGKGIRAAKGTRDAGEGQVYSFHST